MTASNAEILEFSLCLSVTDAAALVAAARKHMIEIGVTSDDEGAREIIEDGDIRLAVRALLDPGQVPGCEVIDLNCE